MIFRRRASPSNGGYRRHPPIAAAGACVRLPCPVWLLAALFAVPFASSAPATSQSFPPRTSPGSAPHPAASPSTPPAWQPVGPLQVNTPAWGLITGSVTSIGADPSDTAGNTVYLGTAGGGVWKSTNAAADSATVQFAPLTDTLSVWSGLPLASLSIGAVSVQPGGTGVVLAGTGDPGGVANSWYGMGILRSADNGNTWSLIYRTATAVSGSRFDFIGRAFAGFAWSTVAPSTVVAAVTDAGYAAITGVSDTRSALGLYYSLDAGSTWHMATIQDGSTVIQSDSILMTGTNAATAVAWNPLRRRFYAAVRYHGYYESSDGIAWTRLAHQPATTLTAALCPANPGNAGSPACPLYRGVIAVQPVTGDMFSLTVDRYAHDQGLWQDACNLQSGTCSSPVQFGARIPDQSLESPAGDGTLPAPYSFSLAAVPARQDTLLFLGTADLWRCSLANSCSWKNTTNTQTCASARVPPLPQAIDATFGASGLLYFGTGSGLWRSTDAVSESPGLCLAGDATHFQNLNGGLGSLAPVEDFAQDPNSPSTWLAALGSLGTAAPSTTGGAAWNQVLDGQADVVAIDPVDPQNWYTTSMLGVDIHACTQGTACTPADFSSEVIGESQVDNDVVTFAPPWILDPLHPSSLLLGTCRVWRGPANGAGWSDSNLLSSMLDGDQGAFCNGNAQIRSLAAGINSASADPDAEQLYAGMAGFFDGGGLIPGHVFTAAVNRDSQASATQWIDRYAAPVVNADAGGRQFNPAGANVSDIYVDPHDPTGQTIYVTIQQAWGSQQNSWILYRSVDAGAHWVNLTANLPQSPANSVLVDPNDANIVYVALDNGVFVTQDVTACTATLAVCWNLYGSGLPTAPVMSLMAYNEGSVQSLRAATWGRGIWQIPLLTAGIAPTTASLSPSALTFSSQPVQTLSAPQTITLTNTGRLDLNISRLSVSGDFTETDTCAGQSIAPSGTCQISVAFDPSQQGARSGTLTVFGNVNTGQLTASLTGKGLAPAAIQLTPSSLDYGTVILGATSPAQSITVANTGGVPAGLTSESVTGDFRIAANTCASSLPAATSCTVSVVFVPKVSGSRTGTLTIVTALGVQNAPLSGTGQTVATDVLAPATLTFSAQQIGTTSAVQPVTLTNSGDEPLTQIVVTSSGDFTVVNNCGALLQGHGSCTITVAYAPTRTGAETGTLTVADELRTQSVSLSGTGLAPPGVTASPSSINFGGYAVGTTSAPQIVTVTNSGGFALTNLAASITAGFAIAENHCPVTLAPGAACPLSLTFSPAVAGSLSGALTVAADNLPRPLTVALSGAGDDFSLDVSGGSSAVVASGQTASYTLQLAGLSGTSGAVALACTGAPRNATCSLNPASVTLTGINPANAAVTVATGVAASAALRPLASSWKEPLLALAVPLAALGLRRRRLASLLILLAACLMLPLGCGVSASAGSGGSGNGSGGGGGSANSTPAGTYTLTITATMSNVTHTTQLTLTVQ